ncbi:hypothetical protein INT43_006184 [Umbelopsis isabellina]|uniref:Autophagy-related protein 13 n=1 Tax=Mortierella isabellina TaxID=91625 RepID=A0A8H7ULH2_MORIS|nr:hypothetical protein INT43_006184 [Umbelopsis isabellina]
MYSKDRQPAVSTNPSTSNHTTHYKQNSRYESSHNHSSQELAATQAASKPSYDFSPRQDYSNKNDSHIPDKHVASSNVTRNDRRQDHIVQNFYAKVAQIVIQSRAYLENTKTFYSHRYSYSLEEKESIPKRLNRWFNLLTSDVDGLRDDLKFWRHQIAKGADRITPYPMIIDIYLDISKVPDDMVLITNNRDLQKPVNTLGTNGCKIQSILLETWTLQLNECEMDEYSGADGASLLFTDAPLSRGASNECETYEFADILSPIGALSLSVQYRTDCTIQAKYATVKDALGLESAIDDWQLSRLSRRSSNRTEDIEWPLNPYGPSAGVHRYSISPASSISSSFSTEESSTTTSVSYRRPSTPLVSPFKSKSLSSSFGTGSTQTKSIDSYPTSESNPPRNFSSSFERYYSNKAGREDDDYHSTSVDCSEPVSAESFAHQKQDPQAASGGTFSCDDELSVFMGIVEDKPDLKMFRRPSLRTMSSYEDGERDLFLESGSIGKSKAALSRFQYMKTSHTSLSESLSSSNTSSRPMSTAHSATDNLSSSISSISSFRSRELSNSGASHHQPTEIKSSTSSRQTADAKRASFLALQPKAIEEVPSPHSESYRTRRVQVSPPLVDRFNFKPSRQSSRPVSQTLPSTANRGYHRSTVNGYELFSQNTPPQEEDDPLIFAMNDMEHH